MRNSNPKECAITTPPLNALRSFETVARLGSFKAAGDALCVTQSAISHQIRKVEDWLGKPLFEREGNRTRLLPHGIELAQSLSLSFNEIEAACQRTRSPNQPLSIAAIPSVAMCWLIPRLRLFNARHPGIETRIVYAMHGRDIDFQDIHIAFVFSKAPPTVPNVESRFFLSGKSLPVCSPALLQSFGRKPETSADFLRLGLLHDGSPAGWKDWLLGQETSETSETVVKSGATFEDFNLLRAAALSGQGVALCPLAMVQPDLNSGALVQLSDRMTPESSSYYMLSTTSASAQTLRQAQIFRDWALAECGATLDAAR